MQYHQQLEQKNETKRFQEMLNHGENKMQTTNSKPDITVPTDDSIRTWYARGGTNASPSMSVAQGLWAILIAFHTIGFHNRAFNFQTFQFLQY